MKTYVHLLQYQAELFSEIEMFYTIKYQNHNTHFMFNNFRPTIVRFTDMKCKCHGGIRHANYDI